MKLKPIEESITIKRAFLLKTASQKGLSADLIWEISLIIKSTYEKTQSSKSAEAKAEQITNLINSCKTEQEIWDKLETLK